MKNKGKILVSLALVLALTIGSPIVSIASGTGSSFTTIPRQNYANSDASGHTEVINGDTVGFTLYTKRESDTFSVYNLTNVNLNSSTQNGIVTWNDTFAAWIKDTYEVSNPTDYALFKSPINLGWSKTGDTSLTNEAKTVELLRALKAAMDSDPTLKASMDNYLIAFYKGDGEKDHSDNVKKLETGVQRVNGGTDITWAGAYEISDVNFGLFYVDSQSSDKTYQPLLVDVVPAQTGPTGHWYVDNTIEATMKYEDLKIEKSINGKGKKSDIVHYGEIVHFDVDVQLPHYDHTASEYIAAFDDMQQGFTLITTSATLKYYDANGNVYHPQSSGLSTDVYGNVKVGDIIGTYTSTLCETAYPFYIEGNEHETVLYATPTSTEGVYQIWGVVNGALTEVNQGAITQQATLRQGLTSLNQQLDAKGLPQYTMGTLVQAEYTRALISITFDYTKLMNPETYVKNDAVCQNTDEVGEFTIPEGMYVSYDAVVNENTYVGDLNEYDVNTNTVRLYYVDDPTGHIGCSEDQVRAWTYSTQIVKVDGDKYDKFDSSKPVNEETNPDPYLEGAKFNVYKYDLTYCGSNDSGEALYDEAIPDGTVRTTLPSSSDYSYYYFLKDSIGNDTYPASKKAWVGELATYIKYEYTYNKMIYDKSVIQGAIGAALGAGETGVDGSNIDEYVTAAAYANKYNKVPGAGDNDTLDILKNWVIPGAKDTGLEYYIIPNKVERCTNCSTEHYHLDAYVIFYDGITSTADAEGVTKNGFDDNPYLLVEKQAPTSDEATYNVMNEALRYEFVKAARTSDGSYAGFRDDAGNACDDGVYNLLVRNYTGLTLPSTGGMGTMLFTVIGIILMASVCAMVIFMKRKKMKQVSAFIAILALIATTFSALAVPSYAVTPVTLNGSSVNKITSDGTTSFKVDLKESTDTIEVFKLAESVWNSATNAFVGPNWLSSISGRLSTISNDIGEATSKLTSPIVLGQQTNDVQDKFLEWLYTNRSSNSLNTSQVPSSKISYSGKTATVNNVSYGVYLVKGTNESLGRSYGLITANAIPVRLGPDDAWTIDSNLTVTLKFSDIKVSKTINDGKESATVTVGDTVHFKIEGDVPDYPAVDEDGVLITDEDLIESFDYSVYEYNFSDDMSPAFDYDDSTFTIKGKTADGEFETLNPEFYTKLFKSKATDATGSSGIMVYEDNVRDGKNFLYADVTYTEAGQTYSVDWYSYNIETGSLKKLGTTSTAPTASIDDTSLPGLSQGYKDATGLEISGSFTRVAKNRWVDIKAISFDYSKLRENGILQIEIKYDATVNSNISVGTQDNYNSASFYYQKDLGGNVVPKTSTVHVYTYAVQIMKVDGENNTPLPGAQFILFQNKYIYVPKVANADPTNPAHFSQFYFAQNAKGDDAIVDESDSVPEIIYGTEEAPENVTINTFDKLNAQNLNNRYYYRYIDMPAGECAYAACFDHENDHKHIYVYEAIDVDGNGDHVFESADTAVGVTVKGLAARDYALIEVKAPDGYNILTEAVLFKIKELTEAQATALMGEASNLAGFVSDVVISPEDLANAADIVEVDGKYYQAYKNGSYPITIKNFAGIKLPNTGGIGTKIFTALGISLMGAVLVLLVLRNRRKEEY